MHKTQGSLIKTALYFSRGYGYSVAGLVFICIISSVIPSIDSFFLKKMVDIVSEASSTGAKGTLGSMLPWIIGFGLWYEACNLLWRGYDYLYLKTIPPIKGKVIDETYNYVQYHSHRFFKENFTGSISHRITDAARSLEWIFAILNEKIIRKLAVIVVVILTMAAINPMVSLIFSLWLLVFLVITVVFSDYIMKYSKTFTKNKAVTVGKLVDVITNISSVRMFSAHNFERKYLNNYVNNITDSEKEMQWFMLKLRYVLGVSCSILMFCLVYALTSLLDSAKITVGDFVMVLSLSVTTIEEVWDLMQEVSDFYEEAGAFRYSMSLVKPYLIEDRTDAKELMINNGKIEFKNVSFRYEIGKGKRVFQDQSVIVPGKQRVGLVGFSGSGKSSFISLISRIYEIDNGSILIDDQNINNVTQRSLRDNVSIIPQEPILFHRSIRENIKYGKQDCSEEDIEFAAEKANIHKFVMSLPEGYDTLCGEQGSNLSGGQRQMIMIARAILKNSPILILDEATSSLDNVTESLIQASLEYLMINKTVLVIAHRLSTILHLDRILVFDDGVIVEDGTHEDLLKNGDVYKKLWQSQIHGFLPETLEKIKSKS